MDASAKVRRNPNIAYRIIEGQALLINPADGTMYPLNDVGTRIWELLAEPRTAAAVAGCLGEEFGADPVILEQDTREFMAQALDRELLISGQSANTDANCRGAAPDEG